MSALPELLDANEAYAASFDRGALEIAPAKRVLVITCSTHGSIPAACSGSTWETRT